MKKVLGVILGVLMIAGGIFCLASPTTTYSAITICIGIAFIEAAIGYFILWRAIKRRNGKSGVLVFNFVISLIAGILLIVNSFAQFFMETFLLYFIASYMVVTGIIDIVNAFKLKKFLNGGIWVVLLISGILVTICGIMSFINPISLAIAIGVVIAVNIIVAGVNMIIISLASGNDVED